MCTTRCIQRPILAFDKRKSRLVSLSMNSTQTSAVISSKKSVYLAVLAMTSMVAIAFLTQHLSYREGLRQLEQENTRQLEQFAGHLESQLARFQILPQLIADNPLLLTLLKQPNDERRIDETNRWLQRSNFITGASDTYLMDRNGLTLAASNWDTASPFIGKNFSFRPYFNEAIQGRLGRYFALGSTSKKRGYYFSYPVRKEGLNQGVIVIKMDLSNIEQDWSERSPRFIVHDPDGVIFITTHQQWLYRSIRPIPQQRLVQIKSSRRYGEASIQPLGVAHARQLSNHNTILEIDQGGGQSAPFLTTGYDMPEAGWSMMILSPVNDVLEESLISTLLVTLALITLALLGIVGWQRYKRRLERERIQRDAKKQLEHQVSIRTANLRHEIEQRKQAETTLRETQSELIQTAKLAVLGEMSASISHELNNPLAAIRSYADNAQQFLQRDKTEAALENLKRIGDLTERMAKISLQLKFFSRKSLSQRETLKLNTLIQTAIDIACPQARNQTCDIRLQPVADAITVRVDPVQLEQVLINLINNAIQALSGLDDRIVSISCEQTDGQVSIHIDDSGQGIQPDHLERIFAPFFTTRESGLGLGLSISARIIDNMDGILSASNRSEGGARFTISLPAHQQGHEQTN